MVSRRRRRHRPPPGAHRSRGDAVGGEVLLESSRPRPAGSVFVVMILALVVGALLNASSLADSARQRAFDDPWRGPAVSFWGGVERVAAFVGLDRPRRGIEEALGRADDGRDDLDVADLLAEDGDGPDDDRGPDEPTTTTSTTAPPVPVLRAPTAEAPLRVYVGGDSVSTFLAREFQRIGGEMGVLDVTADPRVVSGLSRPDYFNWPVHLADSIVPTDPEVVVLLFGSNDGQAIQLDDGTICDRFEACWLDEYRRRVGGVMDLLRDPDGDRVVYWVGLPNMKPGTVRFPDTYNGVYATEAASRPWVTYVDTYQEFSDAAGAWAPRLPDAAGNLDTVRDPDGVHLSRVGGARMAWSVIRVLAAGYDLGPWSGVVSADEAAPEVTERPAPAFPEARLID